MEVLDNSSVFLPSASINTAHLASNLYFFEDKGTHAVFANIVRITEMPKVPLWEKYTLSIDEAAEYFGIGQNRLRSVVASNPSASYLITVGAKTLIKRKIFEKYIDEAVVM